MSITKDKFKKTKKRDIAPRFWMPICCGRCIASTTAGMPSRWWTCALCTAANTTLWRSRNTFKYKDERTGSIIQILFLSFFIPAVEEIIINRRDWLLIQCPEGIPRISRNIQIIRIIIRRWWYFSWRVQMLDPDRTADVIPVTIKIHPKQNQTAAIFFCNFLKFFFTCV